MHYIKSFTIHWYLSCRSDPTFSAITLWFLNANSKGQIIDSNVNASCSQSLKMLFYKQCSHHFTTIKMEIEVQDK